MCVRALAHVACRVHRNKSVPADSPRRALSFPALSLSLRERLVLSRPRARSLHGCDLCVVAAAWERREVGSMRHENIDT